MSDINEEENKKLKQLFVELFSKLEVQITSVSTENGIVRAPNYETGWMECEHDGKLWISIGLYDPTKDKSYKIEALKAKSKELGYGG